MHNYSLKNYQWTNDILRTGEHNNTTFETDLREAAFSQHDKALVKRKTNSESHRNKPLHGSDYERCVCRIAILLPLHPSLFMLKLTIMPRKFKTFNFALKYTTSNRLLVFHIIACINRGSYNCSWPPFCCRWKTRKLSCWFDSGPHNSVLPIWNAVIEKSQMRTISNIYEVQDSHVTYLIWQKSKKSCVSFLHEIWPRIQRPLPPCWTAAQPQGSSLSAIWL